MTDFEYDVRERKRLANQARHMKRGSKSKKCNLPTDHMTRRQWEKRCGEVMSYQLGVPMTWGEFKTIPADIQALYLNDLIKKYNPSARYLAWMFGCTSETLSRYCAKMRFDIKFQRGHRMGQQQKEAFERLVLGDKPPQKELDSTGGKDCLIKVSEPEDFPSTAGKMEMDGVTLHFTGCFDRTMLYNSLLSIIPEGTKVEVTLQCNILEK